eukprot:scaffold4340_cov123-Isochrysis_galbana.AAC.2
MAPRQLRLEPIEADSTADKGAKRVRVDSTEESSTQVQKSRPRDSPMLAHYYASTRFHVSGIQSTAKRAGWIAFHAPATATDPKGGVAILVRADSPHVTIVGGSPDKTNAQK